MTGGVGRDQISVPVADELLRKGVHIAFGAGALLLRWLDPWQAAGFAALALVFNLLLLHPLTGRRLLRPVERERGYSWGVILYPAVVLGAILVFHRRLELAAAVWGLLAFGDGMASVAGVAVGGPRLPWNPRKTWFGLVAFVLWGGTAAIFLVRWTQLAIIVPGPGAAGASAHVGSSFLVTSAQDAIVSQSTLLLAGCLVAALVAGIVESSETGVDDNVTVGVVGSAVVFAASQVEPSRLVEAAGAVGTGALWGGVVTAFLAVGAYSVRGVDRSGALVGWLLGTLLFTFGGWRGYLMLVSLFVLGTAATRLGHHSKSRLGIAQERGGRRGARHALANTVVGVAAAMLAVATPDRELFTLALVAAFATATCDTASSEIGQAYGRYHFLVNRWRSVAAGTQGAVSLIGTLAGVASATAVSAVAASTGLIPWSDAPAVVMGAFVGTAVESLIGSTAAGRRLSNETLNVTNTVVGAGVACAFYLWLR
jgi:uncharacterized protein (TIGR00297 family)